MNSIITPVDKEIKRFAVFSEQQKSLTGEFEYTRPGGGTVIATEVSPNPGCPNNMFPDKQDLGEVGHFVRRISLPKLGFTIS